MNRFEIEPPKRSIVQENDAMKLPEGVAEVRSREADPQVRMSLEAQADLKVNRTVNKDKYSDWVPAVTLDERGCKQYSSWAVEILDGKQYTIQKGDSLKDVARRSLGVTGKPDATPKEIAEEMKRIVALNSDMAVLLNRKNGMGQLPPGVTLKLAEAPKPQAAAKDDKSADARAQGLGCPPRERVVVSQGFVRAENCDKYEYMQGTAGIVRPGADVVVNSGARVFVFGGKVEARSGSRIITVGGDLNADPDARVKFVSSEGIVESHPRKTDFVNLPKDFLEEPKKKADKPANGPQADFSPA